MSQTEKRSNPNAGHRQRTRKEIIENGISAVTPAHKVLEFLLFYCVMQRDTNLLAHEMIDKFGSLSAVLDAPKEELVKFKGITEVGATFLKTIKPVARYCMAEEKSRQFEFSTSDQIGEYMCAQFYAMPKEKMAVMLLDAAGRKKDFMFVSEGDALGVNVPVRKIVQAAINRDAAIAVIAHNHPSATAVPSDADIASTIELRDLLRKIGVRLDDHIIVCGDDYISLKQSRNFSDIF